MLQSPLLIHAATNDLVGEVFNVITSLEGLFSHQLHAKQETRYCSISEQCNLLFLFYYIQHHKTMLGQTQDLTRNK